MRKYFCKYLCKFLGKEIYAQIFAEKFAKKLAQIFYGSYLEEGACVVGKWVNVMIHNKLSVADNCGYGVRGGCNGVCAGM